MKVAFNRSPFRAGRRWSPVQGWRRFLSIHTIHKQTTITQNRQQIITQPPASPPGVNPSAVRRQSVYLYQSTYNMDFLDSRNVCGKTILQLVRSVGEGAVLACAECPLACRCLLPRCPVWFPCVARLWFHKIAGGKGIIPHLTIHLYLLPGKPRECGHRRAAEARRLHPSDFPYRAPERGTTSHVLHHAACFIIGIK